MSAKHPRPAPWTDDFTDDDAPGISRVSMYLRLLASATINEKKKKFCDSECII